MDMDPIIPVAPSFRDDPKDEPGISRFRVWCWRTHPGMINGATRSSLCASPRNDGLNA